MDSTFQSSFCGVRLSSSTFLHFISYIYNLHLPLDFLLPLNLLPRSHHLLVLPLFMTILHPHFFPTSKHFLPPFYLSILYLCHLFRHLIHHHHLLLLLNFLFLIEALFRTSEWLVLLVTFLSILGVVGGLSANKRRLSPSLPHLNHLLAIVTLRPLITVLIHLV